MANQAYQPQGQGHRAQTQHEGDILSWNINQVFSKTKQPEKDAKETWNYIKEVQSDQK